MFSSKFVGCVLALVVAQGAASAEIFVSTAQNADAKAVFSLDTDSNKLTITLTELTPLAVTGTTATTISAPALVGLGFSNSSVFTSFSLFSQTPDETLRLTSDGKNPPVVSVAPVAGGTAWSLSASGLGGGTPLVGSHGTNVSVPSGLKGKDFDDYFLAAAYFGNTAFGGELEFVFDLKGGQSFTVADLDAIDYVTFSFYGGGDPVQVSLVPAPGPRYVPEPTSLALLGLGAMGLLARRRSR